MIRLAMNSVARIALVPLQDVLGAGSEGRMNTPGRASGNWGWRFAPGALTRDLSDRLREMTEIAGRAPRKQDDKTTL